MIKNFNLSLFNSADQLLVGVSGGIDSIVLLHILNSFCRKNNYQLQVVHFNHLLRGRAAARDAEFVEKLAKHYQLPFHLGLKNVSTYAAEHKLSLEDAARILRYTYFSQLAAELKVFKLVLAHNQDDQAETMLMRFLRGSGPLGLSGIGAQVRMGNLEILRPLLKISRQEIEAYARKHRLKHFEDATNKQTRYLRNSLRHKLIPVLEKYNPNLKETLARSSVIFQDEDEYLQQEAKKSYAEVVLQESVREIKLDASSLKNYPRAIQRRIVRLAIEKLTGYLQTISLLFVENFLENELTTVALDDAGDLKVSK